MGSERGRSADWRADRPYPSMRTSDDPSSDDGVARALRGFGPAGLLALLVILFTGNLIGTALVFVWAVRSHTPWRSLGIRRSRRWIQTVTVGLLAGTAFKLLMKAVVMPVLGADPINPAYHYLAGNSARLPGILFTVIVGGGFGEEVIWRGYLFERLRKLFGPSVGARLGVLLLSALLFGLAHYPDQGVAGAEQAVVTGLVFGTVYLATGALWLPMALHAAFDVTAVLLIYWNLESAVAHWFFR